MFRLFSRDGGFASGWLLDSHRDWSAADTLTGARVITLLAGVRSDAAAGIPEARTIPVLADDLDLGRLLVFAGLPAVAPTPDTSSPGADSVEQPVAAGGTPTPQPAPVGDPDAASFTFQVGIVQPLISTGTRTLIVAPDFEHANMTGMSSGWAETYLLTHSNPLPPQVEFDSTTIATLAGMVADLSNMTPSLNTLVLDGDLSAGFTMSSLPHTISQMVLAAGNDYDLVLDDSSVAGGFAFLVDAHALGAGDHVAFDGSAVTAGSFTFHGGGGGDRFFGGAGDDWIGGAGGADMLSGGAGHDTFAYTGAADSTGTTFDTLIDFNPAEDHIDLPGGVSSVGAAIETGSLSLASFDADLAAALGGLGASQAALFAPDAGDFAGDIFLVVDANGVAGYQAGEDYVFAITGTTLADLTSHGTGLFV